MLQNRVTPTGDIIAIAERGQMMGNRGGRFHNPETKTLIGNRRSVSRRWICCRLEWRGRQRRVWGNSYTELFFSDDVAALSAGHRPCFECRRQDAVAFQQAWAKAQNRSSLPTADEMDLKLEEERCARQQSLLAAPDGSQLLQKSIADLPNGCFVLHELQPALVWDRRLFRWSFSDYTLLPPTKAALPQLTPNAILSCLKAGYRPLVTDPLLAALQTR